MPDDRPDAPAREESAAPPEPAAADSDEAFAQPLDLTPPFPLAPLGLELCEKALERNAYDDVVHQFKRRHHELDPSVRPALAAWLITVAAESWRRAVKIAMSHQPLNEEVIARLKNKAARTINFGNPLQDPANTCLNCGARLWGGGGPAFRRSLGWRTVNLDGIAVTFCELCFGRLTGTRPSKMTILRLQQSGRLLVWAHYLDPANHEIYHKLNELDRLLWGLGAPPQFAWPKGGMRPDGTTASLPHEEAKARLERARRVWSVIGWGALALIALGMASNLFSLAADSEWGFLLLVPILTLVFGLLLWRLIGRKNSA